MRLLCPNIEKDRSKYGLRESSLAKIFIKALNVDANASEDAKRLLKWKSSTSGSGEFSNILISILQKRWTAKEKPIHLTIGQVNEKLDELASIWVQDQATAAGSSKSKTSTM